MYIEVWSNPKISNMVKSSIEMNVPLFPIRLFEVEVVSALKCWLLFDMTAHRC
jgi:hypothetical protein